MMGRNLLQFELEGMNYEVGSYRVGKDVWVDISMGKDGLVVETWRDSSDGRRRTYRRFTGISARMIAVKVLDVGRSVEHMPIWRIQARKRGLSPDGMIMGRA